MTRTGAASAAGTSSVLYKSVDRQPLWAVGDSHGMWLQDRDGRRYLDTCGGVAVSSLGHAHPRVVAAIERHAKDLSWAHAGSFTTTPAEELAELLTRSSGLSRAQFLSGGSEAMELGMKIAYQYHVERGEPERTVMVSRRQSYHGSTLGTLAVSGNRQRRSIFEQLLGPAEFVSPCYEYRDRRPDESQQQYVDRLVSELDDTITMLGSGRVAAFIAETVVGSTNGAVPAAPGYLTGVAAVCRHHGVLLLLDEVMAGLGRTGHPHAFLEDGVVPDLLAVGKGLAAGYQPISAILLAEHVRAALAAGSGVLQNGQTHVNHPLACAVALEVQQTVTEEDLLANVLARGEQLRAGLVERLADNPHVGDVRGRGLFLGVEFVTDRASGRPTTGGAALVTALKQEGFRRGLLLYPGSGTVDGETGNHVLFAPPFIASEDDIDQMVELFGQVVEVCL